MPRILRNYLISFFIIGLVVLAVHLVNRWAAHQAPGPASPPAEPLPAPAAGGAARP